MILKKIVNEDGKIIYEPIEIEEALNLNKKELVFTDEDEEERYDHFGDEEDEEGKEETQKIKNKTISIDLSNIANLGNKISRKITEKLNNQNTKTQKIISLLPFLDDDDISEIVNEIINDSEEYKDLPLESIMPFLPDEDADRLFMEFVGKDNLGEEFHISSIVPFVSEKCLDKFVEEYINGKYQKVDIDSLYPFMDSKTVKKLFKHILYKKENM